MQTVVLKSRLGAGAQVPRVSGSRKAVPACCLLPAAAHSIQDLWGKEGSQGSLESEAGQNGERKAGQPSYSSRSATLLVKATSLCLGLPGTAPDSHKRQARFGESEACETRASQRQN